MKHLLILVTILCATGIIGILSCKKNNNSNPSSGSLAEVFADLKYTPQNIIINAGQDTFAYGSKGTMFHFYSNSFKDENGNIIKSGKINLAIIEMYKAVDMICNRVSTIANGELLQSGGQIQIIATMNGKTVLANKYGIGFRQSNSSKQQMEIYTTKTGDTLTNWTMVDTLDGRGNVTYGTDTPIQSDRPVFFFDSVSKFYFINCDHIFSSDSPRTGVGVILPDTSFNPENTQVYLIFPETKTALTISNYYNRAFDSTYNWDLHQMKLGTANKLYKIPTGLNYEFVVISKKDGNYYFYQTSGVTYKDMILTANMVMDSRANILTKLEAL